MNGVINNIIEISKALLTPTIAILGTYIAFQQYQISNRKHQIEIYDRRMKIYMNAVELFRQANREGTITEEAFYAFDRSIAEAAYLFGKEVVDLLEDMSSVTFQIVFVKQEADYEPRPIHVTAANKKHSEYVCAFLSFHDRINEVFSPYLRYMSKYKPKDIRPYTDRISDTLPETPTFDTGTKGDSDLEPF